MKSNLLIFFFYQVSLTYAKSNKKNNIFPDSVSQLFTIPQPLTNFIKIYLDKELCGDNTSFLANFCISKNNQCQSIFDSDYATNDVQINSIILSKDYYQDVKSIYYTITTRSDYIEKCIINYESLDEMPFDFDQSMIFSIKGKNNEKTITFNFPPDYFIDKEPMILYALSPRIKEFDMNIIASKRTGANIEESKIEIDEVFYNGYAVLLSEKYKEYEIKIIIKADNNPIITLKNRHFSNKNYQKIKELEIMYGVLYNEEGFKQECFDFYSQDTILFPESYLINIISYTTMINFFVINNTNTDTIITPIIDKIIDSTTSLITHALHNHSICFKIDDNTPILYKYVGYSFQLLKNNNYSKNQLFLRPLNNGRTITAMIPANEVMIYHLEKRLEDHEYTEIYLKKQSSSNIMIYGTTCQSFYSCTFTNETIHQYKNELLRVHEINDVFQISLHSIGFRDPFLNIAIVHCNSNESCLYSIGMHNEYDYILLRQNILVYKAISKGNIHKFIFKHYDPNTKIIIVSLFSYTGKAKMIIYKDKDMKEELIGTCVYTSNKLSIYFEKTENKDLVRHYYIKVEGISNSYYSIIMDYFELLEEKKTVIANGDIILDALNTKKTNKTIEFIANYVDFTRYIGFFITITQLSCKMKYTLLGKEYLTEETNNDYQYNFFFNYSLSLPQSQFLDVEIVSYDSKMSAKSDCLMLIGSSYISKEKQLLLIEGYKHTIEFSDRLEEIIYNYPYWFVGYKENLLISMTTNGPIEFNYKINGKGNDNFILIEHIDKLPIPSYKLDENCSHNYVCSILIILRKKSGSVTTITPIKGSIQVTAVNSIPIYLHKEEIHNDFVFEDRGQYYYTDITEPEGKIIIHFLRGSGYAVAKLVAKDEIEENPNWNNRVRLPDINEKNQLKYDYYHSTITYENTDTLKCKEKGCELYIGVFSAEENSILFSSFSIIIKESSEKPLRIELNNHYFGYTKKNKIDLYLLFIKDNITKISIEFNTISCNIIISEYNDLIIETDYHKIQERNSFMIQAKDFNWPSFQNRKLQIVITLISTTHTFLFSDYNFRFISIFENTSIPITQLDFIQTQYCNILSDKAEEYCRYVLKIHDYDYMSNYLVAAFHHNPQHVTDIYAYQKNELDYNKLSPQEIENSFPTKDTKDFTSVNSILSFARDSKEDLVPSSYALITISSKEKGKIKIVSNWGNYPSTTLLIPNTQQLYYLSKHKEMTLIVKGNEAYQIEIVRLKGQGFATKWTPDETYEMEINSINESINILMVPNDHELNHQINLIKIKTKDYSLSYSVIYYKRYESLKSDKGKLFSLSSYYYTSLFDQTFISINSPIYNSKLDVLVNIYFEDEVICRGEDDKLNIITAFIYHIIFNSSSKSNTNGFLNPFFKTGYITLRNNNRHIPQDELLFLQTTINFSKNNPNPHKQFKFKFLAFPLQLSDDIPLSQHKSLPNDTFILSSISSKHSDNYIMKLSRNKETKKHVSIELIAPSDSLLLSITPIKKPKSKLDNQNRLITYRKEEKYLESIDLKPDELGIVLNIRLKPSAHDKDFILPFAIRFKITDEPLNHCYVNSKITNITFSANKTKIAFETIKSSQNKFVDAEYTIGIFNGTSINKTLTNDQMAMLFFDTLPMNIYHKTVFNYNKQTVKYDISHIPSGDYYVAIIGSTTYNGYQENIWYDVVLITVISSNFTYHWIILIVVGIIVAVIMMVYLCYDYEKKTKSKNNEIKDITGYISEEITDSLVIDN